MNSDGTIAETYIYDTKVNIPEYVIRDGNTYRIITDHLGSLRLVIDTTDGTVKWDLQGQITFNIAERITIYFNSFKIYGVWLLFNMGLSIYISVVIMIGKSLSKITIWFVYLLIITGIILFIWSFFEANSPLGTLLIIVPFSIAHLYMLKYLKYYQISNRSVR